MLDENSNGSDNLMTAKFCPGRQIPASLLTASVLESSLTVIRLPAKQSLAVKMYLSEIKDDKRCPLTPLLSTV